MFPLKLATTGCPLQDMWRSAGFGDAFEGPVDVANRVAELLMLRQGWRVEPGRGNDLGVLPSRELTKYMENPWLSPMT